MMTTSKRLILILGLAQLGACQSAESPPASQTPVQAADSIESASPVFAYLLGRYDVNGDGTITPMEYTRHAGQLARWDMDQDGRLTEADWKSEDAQIGPQIQTLQRMDVLGRYFQTDENGPLVLTIDELANAFFAYDEAGTADEELSEDEFRAGATERAIEMPGDGSMMMKSYLGQADGWRLLTSYFDSNASQTISMQELAVAFESTDVYELRFDQVRFDDGDAGAHFQDVEYQAGLVVGSAVPAVQLTPLKGGTPIDLAQVAGGMPIALIFGSYT